MGRAAAQDTLITVEPRAQVGSIDFKFPGTQSFSTSDLQSQLELKARPSMYGVKRVLGKLPLISDPETHGFDPVELQKDVVRLRRFYRESGFLNPSVDYSVRTNAEGTLVNVDFLIAEGQPVLLRELMMVGAEGEPGPALPTSLQGEWGALTTDLRSAQRNRFGAAEGLKVEAGILTWLRNRGYPDAGVRSEVALDSLRGLADVTLRVDPGIRRQVGSILVEGNASVSDRVVTRELPFQVGDWISAEALAQGRSRVQQISLFRRVVLDLLPEGATDSAIPVRVRLTEAHPRLTLAEIGYVSAGAGLTGRVQWTHPNFTGGARSLTASLEGQTGVGSLDGQPERLLRSSLILTQPYVFGPRLLASVGPFVEYRDDYRDQSLAIGGTATLVKRLGDLSSIALGYQYSGRHIYEYRVGDVSPGNLSLLTLLSLQNPAVMDSLGTDDDESSFALTSTLGGVDDLVNPRRGHLLRPAIKVTFPASLNTSEFVRLDLTATRFQPIGRKVVLAARASWGRLFPFGKSVPAPGEDPTFSFLRLRDESMTAGGTDDVRGWGTGLLGPKVPNVQATVEGTDTVLVADRYVPLGALARLTGSVELRFPAPGMSPKWGAILFVDGGRVWTPDERFSQSPFLPSSTDFRFAAGAGLSYGTPVGAIRFSLGYKLNPSEADLRDAGEVLDAVLAGAPVSSVSTGWLRRLHLHLSLGLAL